ncbi:hypothetical protein [Microcoleus sp. bin38.metabat.b11b12b14.051]|uniref:hypothetical protein n=1 Tax=Microcoleus sp. bin38.metabat.b11b12b14.051 TaxID=2742709 RepID=UPI0025D65A19|nr:hypothetical protein [Microcoleus sp. bin38.metabat.b11b12b14.051]
MTSRSENYLSYLTIIQSWALDRFAVDRPKQPHPKADASAPTEVAQSDRGFDKIDKSSSPHSQPVDSIQNPKSFD